MHQGVLGLRTEAQFFGSGSGFRGSGFRGAGFRGLGFRVLGF